MFQKVRHNRNVVFVVVFLAHKIKKVKAFKLFFKSWNPPEVARQIAVNIRTCQRWHKEFLEQNPDFAMVGKVPVSVTPIEENSISTHLVEVVEEPLKNNSSSTEWFDWANSLTDTHRLVHCQIREKLTKMLNASLDASEYNIRAIHILSQCLCRHIDAEREIGFLDMLSADAACQKVESLGYEISAPFDASEAKN